MITKDSFQSRRYEPVLFSRSGSRRSRFAVKAIDNRHELILGGLFIGLQTAVLACMLLLG